jgi:antitoxin HigA-1
MKRGRDNAMKKVELIIRGAVLRSEFIEPPGISQNKLACDIGMPVTRVNDIIHGRRGIRADSALRLAVHFGTTPESWLNLQTRYDLKVSKRELLPTIAKVVRPLQAAS